MQKMKKGLPKRCTNTKAKERRQRSWSGSVSSKERRHNAQVAALKENMEELNAMGYRWGSVSKTLRRKLLGQAGQSFTKKLAINEKAPEMAEASA